MDAAKDRAMLGPNKGAITIAPTTTAILSSESPIVTTIDERMTIKMKLRFKSTPLTTLSYAWQCPRHQPLHRLRTYT